MITGMGNLYEQPSGEPRLCRTCAYHRYVQTLVGFDDEPRLRGGMFHTGRSEEPCKKCSANPRFELYYSPMRRSRRLRTFGDSNLVRLAREI